MSTDSLSQDSPIRIQPRVELAPYTTFGIGGPAALFGQPENRSLLEKTLAWAGGQPLRLILLGGGSNVLVADEGLDGLVLNTRKVNGITLLENDRVRCDLGAFLPHLARFAQTRGRGGWEFMSAIPGTVGASCRINAGLGSGGDMAHWVESLDCWSARRGAFELRAEDLEYGYRHSTLLAQPSTLVLGAILRLGPAEDPEVVQGRMDAIMARRREKFPTNPRNCGSVFRGTTDGTPAAVLIDRCGLKGWRIGNCQVSPEHANWIVNLGGGTASDVKGLIAGIIERVEETTGILLRREVVYLPEDLEGEVAG